MYQNIDIFQEGGAANKDALDKLVEAYEQKVPLPAQIAAGFTAPGMALDLATAGKYGRDALEELKAGNIKPGLMYAGIAGLSGLAAVPLFGEIASALKRPLQKGLGSLPSPTTRFDLTRHQADVFTGNTIRDANTLFDRAVRTAPEFNKEIENLASKLNLKTNIPETAGKFGKYGEPKGTIKKIDRMVEKTRTKYDGDITLLTDPIRRRVAVNSPAEEEAFVKLLDDNFVIFDKGRKVKPEGFVDRKLNLQFTSSAGEPIVAEIAILTEPMWRASTKAHNAYEEFRSLFPKGMPTDPVELGKINRQQKLRGKELLKEMEDIFGAAKKEIDPEFYKLEIKKFAQGGYVTTGTGNCGKSLPMTPNLVSKSVLDIFEPSTKKSATWLGSANVQSVCPEAIKKPKSPSPTGSKTAGPSSHVKYNLSIDSIVQKFTKKCNPNTIDIFTDNPSYD